jgi:hypothetical protein
MHLFLDTFAYPAEASAAALVPSVRRSTRMAQNVKAFAPRLTTLVRLSPRRRHAIVSSTHAITHHEPRKLPRQSFNAHSGHRLRSSLAQTVF